MKGEQEALEERIEGEYACYSVEDVRRLQEVQEKTESLLG